MTTDEFARAAYPLLHEGIILLRAHAGEGPAIDLYVAMVEKAREQYRAAKEAPAPAPDVYDGPVTAGMRFGYKDSVFVPDGRRGSKGEFLDADGSGISEPNLRGMYRPIPDPSPEPSTVATGGVECTSFVATQVGPMAPFSPCDTCGKMQASHDIGPPRPIPPVPVHPATGTTCTRCGQVIQSVLPAFPPVATVDGWRHERCPEVLSEPVPVEVDRQGNPRVYPCADCGTMRSLPEGGTTFTVCDECWDKRYPKAPVTPPAAPASEPAVRPFNRIASLEAELARIYTYATDRAEMAEMAKRGLETTEGCLNDALAREARIEGEVEQLRAKLADIVSPDWKPTPAAVNALPPALFRYVADLETNADPAGMVSQNVFLKDSLAGLEMTIENERRQATARVRSMREAAAKAMTCSHCGKRPATCVGAYEDATVDSPACDECCAHGNEDGRCEPIDGPARIRALPLDTGTATDTGGEVTTLCEHGSDGNDGNCRRCYMAEKSARADAIKAAVAKALRKAARDVYRFCLRGENRRAGSTGAAPSSPASRRSPRGPGDDHRR